MLSHPGLSRLVAIFAINHIGRIIIHQEVEDSGVAQGSWSQTMAKAWRLWCWPTAEGDSSIEEYEVLICTTNAFPDNGLKMKWVMTVWANAHAHVDALEKFELMDWVAKLVGPYIWVWYSILICDLDQEPRFMCMFRYSDNHLLSYCCCVPISSWYMILSGQMKFKAVKGAYSEGCFLLQGIFDHDICSFINLACYRIQRHRIATLKTWPLVKCYMLHGSKMESLEAFTTRIISILSHLKYLSSSLPLWVGIFFKLIFSDSWHCRWSSA